MHPNELQFGAVSGGPTQAQLQQAVKEQLAADPSINRTVPEQLMEDAHYELLFTELMDRLMVGWDEELAYRHHKEWGQMLAELGFKVRIVRVPDILPYPHVVIAATKT